MEGVHEGRRGATCRRGASGRGFQKLTGPDVNNNDLIPHTPGVKCVFLLYFCLPHLAPSSLSNLIERNAAPLYLQNINRQSSTYLLLQDHPSQMF